MYQKVWACVKFKMIYCLVTALFTYLMDWLMCQNPKDNRGFFFLKIALKEIDCKQEFH